MEKLVRNPFFIIPIIILVLGFSLYRIFQFQKTDAIQNQSPLAEQVQIQDEMRIIITPISYLPKSSPQFKVQMECFQHPEQTRLDLHETALLQTNTGKPLLPKSWSISKQDEYSTTGIIEFPETTVDYSRIKLTIFANSEIVFEWGLPNR